MQDKRQAVIDKFFTHHDKSTLESLLADDAQIVEQGAKVRTYNKSEWINLMANHVVPAVPDYNWGHSTDGSKDEDGYSIVTVQVTLHSCWGWQSQTGYNISCVTLRHQESIQEKHSAYLVQNCQRSAYAQWLLHVYMY